MSEKARLWANLAIQRRRFIRQVTGVITDRGAPKTPEEQLEMIASLLQSNYDLAKMLAKVTPEERRTAYEQMKTRVRFKVEEFDAVMKLAAQY